ncbi:esterase FE4-like [Aricia agestis]|uniref:esterase FE4-like n=1 Tax=Aricia agestis TaxID=91739 RepID=UPI001C207485|nr:esterase FE4-like [Aricia agestis]
MANRRTLLVFRNINDTLSIKNIKKAENQADPLPPENNILDAEDQLNQQVHDYCSDDSVKYPKRFTMYHAIIFLVALKLTASEDYLELNIKQGPIRGYQAAEGVFVFRGIPYATAPTGRDKFKAPLPPPTWSEPFEATETEISCPQLYSKRYKHTNKREDCLITNIYVPAVKREKLPVVVIIHGGAYQYGYGDYKLPTQLVKSNKVIALNFNYRVGAMGFLCLGTKDVPGNAAMKDQIALLRWVQENIESFGGNPNDVTLYGCSAGGSSVDLHLLSRTSRGLFHKAIPQSGANVAAFSIQPDPIENAQNYARQLNFTEVDDIDALEEFYRNAPYSVLTSINVLENRNSSVVFTPCIERDVRQEMFLDKDPTYILETGDYERVPILYGFTDMEGLLRLSYFKRWSHFMNKKFSDFLPENLEFRNAKQKEKVAGRVKKFYFGNNTVNENTIVNYIHYLGDITFSYGMLSSVKLQAKAGNDNVFFYEYSFCNNKTQYNFTGAGHCAQSNAVLDEPGEEDFPEDYQNMKRTLRELWLNFIVTGSPVSNGSDLSWPSSRSNRSPHMSINSNLILRDTFSDDKRARFWDRIYRRYQRRPVPPTF